MKYLKGPFWIPANYWLKTERDSFNNATFEGLQMLQNRAQVGPKFEICFTEVKSNVFKERYFQKYDRFYRFDDRLYLIGYQLLRILIFRFALYSYGKLVACQNSRNDLWALLKVKCPGTSVLESCFGDSLSERMSWY